MFISTYLALYLSHPSFQEGCLEKLIWVFFIYNTSFVSPPLLQLILVNTLGLRRQLAQRRNDTARKRVDFKHHLKERCQKHGLLMRKDSQHNMCACAIDRSQFLSSGLGASYSPSPAPSAGILPRGEISESRQVLECESRKEHCPTSYLEMEEQKQQLCGHSDDLCVDIKGAAWGIKD